MSARRTAGSARLLPRRFLEPASLPRDAFHELANRLAVARLTAYVEGREQPGPAGASLREVEGLTAQCGVLLAALRALVGRRERARVRVSPATLLDGLGGVLADRPRDRIELKVRRPRGLPDVLVDAELLHHLLLAIAYGALEAVGPRGSVHLFARREGRSVALVIEDDGKPLDLDEVEDTPRSGRGLLLRLAAVLLAEDGARVALARRRVGTRIEVRLRAAAGRPIRRRA
ncbi:MAG: hypothetical protein ABFS46_00240 [Myxococcota bacterium]